MERLLAHWYTISQQPNSGVNLVELKEIMVLSYPLTKFEPPRPSSKIISPKLRTPWKRLMLGRPTTHGLCLLVHYFPNK
ncbi:hypothetical protein ACFX2H_012680 [Malus domestica]